MTIIIVVAVLLVAISFVGCKYIRGQILDGPGMERVVEGDSVDGHSNDLVAEGEKPVKVAGSYSFTEGPAADAKGDVYFTDQPNNRIYRWDCESGEISLFTDQSGRSNGMYFDAQGLCFDQRNWLT